MTELDMMAHPRPLRAMQELATRAEEAGLGALWLTEAGRTAYLGCAAAALATQRLGLGTAVAVAFPRSPMVTASIAWELADASSGRFILGLGTQVKAHIERRYSSEYVPPGPRMREYVEALRVIFARFRDGDRLSFDGDYYSFSLLPAQWSPGPIDAPDPPIYVSAVLPWMSRMAGEVCDGVHIHPFHSPEYLRQTQVPNIVEGARRAGRSADDVTLVIPFMSAVGETDRELHATREHARTMISFYGSTRTYAPVFEQHGFDGLSEELHAAQKAGDFAAMVGLVTDDVLDHYVVTAAWDDLARTLHRRYDGIAPRYRLMSYTAISQYGTDPGVLERWGQVGADLRALS